MQHSKLTVLVIAVGLLVSAAAAAQHQAQTQLSDPGTTPDSILYGFDRAMESVSLALARSPEAKAEKKMEIAEERLSESRELARRNMSELANETAAEYDDNVEDARRFGEQISEAAQRQDIEAVISRATSVHMTVLEEQDVDPAEPGYQAKRTAEETTVETENDSVEKARKQAKVAGHRVNESDRLVDKGRPDLASRTAEQYEDEMQELEQIGQDISDAAQRRAIDEVVARATQAHSEVLQRVMEKVPDQARSAISNAMDVSAQGHQRAVQELRNSGGVPDGIQEDVPMGGDVPGGMAPRDGGNASERLATARDQREQGRQAIQDGTGHLDTNETVEAESAFEDAVSHFDEAIDAVEGLTSSEAQGVLSDTRTRRSNAQQYLNQVQEYNQDTGQTTDGDSTQDGDQTQDTNTTDQQR